MNIHMGSIKDNVNQFLNLYWICYTIACFMFVCLFFFFFFWAKRHILAARPGIELVPLALEGEILTTEPPGKSPILPCLYHYFHKSKICVYVNVKVNSHKLCSTPSQFQKVSFVTKLSCSLSISQKLHKSLQSKLWITTFLNWTYNVYHLWARILLGRMCRKAVIWNMSHNQETNDLQPESWLQNTTFSFGS